MPWCAPRLNLRPRPVLILQGFIRRPCFVRQWFWHAFLRRRNRSEISSKCHCAWGHLHSFPAVRSFVHSQVQEEPVAASSSSGQVGIISLFVGVHSSCTEVADSANKVKYTDDAILPAAPPVWTAEWSELCRARLEACLKRMSFVSLKPMHARRKATPQRRFGIVQVRDHQQFEPFLRASNIELKAELWHGRGRRHLGAKCRVRNSQ